MNFLIRFFSKENYGPTTLGFQEWEENTKNTRAKIRKMGNNGIYQTHKELIILYMREHRLSPFLDDRDNAKANKFLLDNKISSIMLDKQRKLNVS